MKIEAHKREEIREKNLIEAKAEREVIVNQVKDQRHITGEAVQAMKDENRDLRNKIAKEIKDSLKRKADEEAAEMARKQELIRQVRELEKIPIVRTKGFDPTEAGGHGLLEEMSIAELRERIEFNRRKIEQDVEKKRQDNLSSKAQANVDLQDTHAKIMEARNKRKAENDTKRKAKQDAAQQLEDKRKAIRE